MFFMTTIEICTWTVLPTFTASSTDIWSTHFYQSSCGETKRFYVEATTHNLSFHVIFWYKIKHQGHFITGMHLLSNVHVHIISCHVMCSKTNISSVLYLSWLLLKVIISVNVNLQILLYICIAYGRFVALLFYLWYKSRNRILFASFIDLVVVVFISTVHIKHHTFILYNMLITYY